MVVCRRGGVDAPGVVNATLATGGHHRAARRPSLQKTHGRADALLGRRRTPGARADAGRARVRVVCSRSCAGDGADVGITMEVLFWLAVCGVVYPYLGYPALLWLLGTVTRRATDRRRRGRPAVGVDDHSGLQRGRAHRAQGGEHRGARLPGGSAADPVRLGRFDGRHRRHHSRQRLPGMQIIELPGRGGKAAALNAGLAAARHEMLVFSDASIELEPGALRQIVAAVRRSGDRLRVRRGSDCRIRRRGALRPLRAVAAAARVARAFDRRRERLVLRAAAVICQPFTEGMAPDFLSVLRTVEQGYRAVSEPRPSGR